MTFGHPYFLLLLLLLPALGWLAGEKIIRVLGRLAAGLIGLWFILRGILQLSA